MKLPLGGGRHAGDEPVRTHAGADILLGRDCLGPQAPMRRVSRLIDGGLGWRLLTPASM